MNKLIIRKETSKDYKETELMTMRAFWNIHGPGCNEHLLVHKIRKSPDYLPELSRIAELDGKIVGAILYTKAWIISEEKVHEIVTFGPLAVDPTAQHLGVGRRLLEETMELAKEKGYSGICIFGEPGYYPKYGFKTCDQFGITDMNGKNYDALMGYELYDGAFDNIHGKLKESEVFEECDDKEELEAFTKQFPEYKRLKLNAQWLHEERLGRIANVQKNAFTIRFWEMELPAKLRGRFYDEGLEFPVVGDYVTFDYNPDGDSRIRDVCERTSLLSRPDQSGHAIGYVKNMKEQVMVSNVDYVFITVSLNDNYNKNRIARYVATVVQGKAVPVVILTKADLCANPEHYVEEVRELSDIVKVHTVCSIKGEGIEELRQYMEPDKTIALLGSSGVGKSTLLNTLAGHEVMKTGGIREEDAKGRHTTTYRQMIVLENGTTIIDTPGMREFGLMSVEEGINETFSDIEELENMCKFRNCAHKTEPGCAIKQALEEGELSKERYDLYCNLKNENKKHVDMKAIAKYRKQLKKH